MNLMQLSIWYTVGSHARRTSGQHECANSGPFVRHMRGKVAAGARAEHQVKFRQRCKNVLLELRRQQAPEAGACKTIGTVGWRREGEATV